jgi:hypothetical protein
MRWAIRPAQVGRKAAIMNTITLRNDFHNSEVTLRAVAGQELSLLQVLRARRILCGIKGCTCGGNLGERGQQAVEVDVIGYDNVGHLRIRLC